jgi:hypothetical protein
VTPINSATDTANVQSTKKAMTAFAASLSIFILTLSIEKYEPKEPPKSSSHDCSWEWVLQEALNKKTQRRQKQLAH